jgi:phosphoglycerate dehydrogenase-like enzyme
VTFAADDDARALIGDTFSGIASVTFAADVDDDQRVMALRRADALLSWVVGDELGEQDWSVLFARPPRLAAPPLLLQTLSAGVDHVPFAAIPSGIAVAGNAGGWAEPVAEHVLAMVLALAKRLIVERAELRRGAFNQEVPTRELRGGTCAILGFGGIGRAVATLMRALEMRIHALNSSGRTLEPVDFVGALGDLEHVLRAADVVVVALPLTTTTRGLIGARELGWMRPDAILVNVARGPLIDEDALYRHLVDHPRFSAAVDVWWDEPFVDGRLRVGHPFVELPNFLGSPHNSGIVSGWFELGLRRAAGNVRRYLLGEPYTGLVRREDYA